MSGQKTGNKNANGWNKYLWINIRSYSEPQQIEKTAETRKGRKKSKKIDEYIDKKCIIRKKQCQK
jgi:hypothetical protein